MSKHTTTINIAPTWEWTVAMLLKLIEDGNQKKAEKGFLEEVERLGEDMKLLVEDFRNFKGKTREKARELLIAKARRIDLYLEKKGKYE